MFNLENIFKKTISKEEISKILKTNPQALEEFEKAYQKASINNPTDNFFEINSKEASQARQSNNEALSNTDEINMVINKIVEELVSSTVVWEYKNKTVNTIKGIETNNLPLELKDISHLDKKIAPQLTGNLMYVDVKEPSYIALLDNYNRYQKTNKKIHYDRFRQGLDILDLDEITYRIIGTNVNSIGYWLPKIVQAVDAEGFFKIPETTIIKVPITLLQLTRKEYMELNNTTIKILNEFCKKVFKLNNKKEYFIKTGTYSSKFDFRNAHVKGEKEVDELGEYLMFIHHQALCMAHYSLSKENPSPSIYGVSTTNEWCVREFISDKDNNPTIYNGLPLHTEYRVFVDFDTNEVLYIHPYWDSHVMKERFGNSKDSETIKMKHDYISFLSCEDKLNETFIENKNLVIEHIKAILPNINLSGQWSVDVMQNGSDFWIIDMALAEDSAYYAGVPYNLRRKNNLQNWIPKLL